MIHDNNYYRRDTIIKEINGRNKIWIIHDNQLKLETTWSFLWNLIRNV
jgi:hypothetical protein